MGGQCKATVPSSSFKARYRGIKRSARMRTKEEAARHGRDHSRCHAYGEQLQLLLYLPSSLPCRAAPGDPIQSVPVEFVTSTRILKCLWPSDPGICIVNSVAECPPPLPASMAFWNWECQMTVYSIRKRGNWNWVVQSKTSPSREFCFMEAEWCSFLNVPSSQAVVWCSTLAALQVLNCCWTVG